MIGGGRPGLHLWAHVLELAAKEHTKKKVCSIPSRWWPSVTLCGPQSIGHTVEDARRRRLHRPHMVSAFRDAFDDAVGVCVSMWKGTPTFVKYWQHMAGKPGCFGRG